VQSGRNPPAILDALGDPMRRVIYQRLVRGRSNVTALAKGLPVTRSAVSRHLRVLKDAGLVQAEADGRNQVYSPCGDGLAPLAAWISRMQGGGGREG
jgi:DNA-binding transcriptional ArsR family regulator